MQRLLSMSQPVHTHLNGGKITAWGNGRLKFVRIPAYFWRNNSDCKQRI